MYRYFASLIALLILVHTTQAQVIKENSDSVFHTEDNKLYVNKNQGVYIWLSSSQNSNAEMQLLESEVSEAYCNPMYFDTEGYNTIRSPYAVDTSTKRMVFPAQDIIFEVYADGIPPVTRTKPTYRETSVVKGERHYKGPVSISLRAYDQVSGIRTTYVSLNSENFTEYSEPLTSATQGKNTLRFYSVDKVGNTEEVREEVFYVDVTTP